MGAGYGTSNLSMGMTAAGGIMQAGSSIMQGMAANSYYKQLALAAESQARLGEIAAAKENDYTARAAAYETSRLNDDNAKIMAGQRAALAANGITGSVTGEDLIADSINAWAKDKSAIRYNAEVKQFETAQAAKINSINSKSADAQYRIAGKNAQTSAFINAGAGLLGTAGTVAGQWYGYKNAYDRPAKTSAAAENALKSNPYYRSWNQF